MEYDPYAALRLRDYRLYWSGNTLSVLGLRMQTAAVFWEVYERTGRPWALALVGLVQVLPVVLLAVVTGYVADRLDRRRVVLVAMAVIAASSMGLCVISLTQAPVALMYVCLGITAVARAFLMPAKASLLPRLVPRDRFANAVTWNSAGFQLAAAVGPAISGMLIAATHRGAIVYLADAAAALIFGATLTRIRLIPHTTGPGPMTLGGLTAGIKYVWNHKVLLGALALDMFAVVLGGATTLLPVYAKDILKVGPVGLGWMLAAEAIGALSMSLILSHRPPMERAGRTMLWSVVGFGVVTIVLGVSRWYPLTFVALLLLGSLDCISVVVRHTLVQLQTPDEMRGRVSAINSLFITVSNELGGVESGSVAELLGPKFSVVSGGVGTLVVVAVIAWWIPQLRCYGRLDEAV